MHGRMRAQGDQEIHLCRAAVYCLVQRAKHLRHGHAARLVGNNKQNPFPVNSLIRPGPGNEFLYVGIFQITMLTDFF